MLRPSKDGPAPPIRPSNEGFLATPAPAANPEQWKDEFNIFSAHLLSQDMAEARLFQGKYKSISS